MEGKFIIENKETINSVTPEDAVDLVSGNIELFGLVAAYVAAQGGEPVEWLNPDLSDLKGLRQDIEAMLKEKKIHLKQSKDGSDTFVSFIKCFRERLLLSSKPRASGSAH